MAPVPMQAGGAQPGPGFLFGLLRPSSAHVTGRLSSQHRVHLPRTQTGCPCQPCLGGPAPGALAHSTSEKAVLCSQLCPAPRPQRRGPKPVWGSQRPGGRGPSLGVTPSILPGSGDVGPTGSQSRERDRGPSADPTPGEGRGASQPGGPVHTQPQPARTAGRGASLGTARLWLGSQPSAVLGSPWSLTENR